VQIKRQAEKLSSLEKAVGAWKQHAQSSRGTPGTSVPGTPGLVGASVPGTPGQESSRYMGQRPAGVGEDVMEEDEDVDMDADADEIPMHLTADDDGGLMALENELDEEL